MLRRTFVPFLVFALVLITPILAYAKGGRAGSTMSVYVTSQGLYYDTFVARDPLPMKGPFQLLEDGMTEFGPGDPGYLGGRWWEDLNGNGIQDPDDHYFLCPLLPPGRVVPLSLAMRALTQEQGGRPAAPGVVYVSSQGLYYDTFVVVDPLPMKGKFQLLEDGVTEFGPGDPGYLGGRWWEDVNGDGIQDPEDHYFLCPLLPPGRETP
ncbi:MAG: hypothetical protein ACJ76J_08075 [Thermoanaerobaculia bacterium]